MGCMALQKKWRFQRSRFRSLPLAECGEIRQEIMAPEAKAGRGNSVFCGHPSSLSTCFLLQCRAIYVVVLKRFLQLLIGLCNVALYVK